MYEIKQPYTQDLRYRDNGQIIERVGHFRDIAKTKGFGAGLNTWTQTKIEGYEGLGWIDAKLSNQFMKRYVETSEIRTLILCQPDKADVLGFLAKLENETDIDKLKKEFAYVRRTLEFTANDFEKAWEYILTSQLYFDDEDLASFSNRERNEKLKLIRALPKEKRQDLKTWTIKRYKGHIQSLMNNYHTCFDKYSMRSEDGFFEYQKIARKDINQAIEITHLIGEGKPSEINMIHGMTVDQYFSLLHQSNLKSLKIKKSLENQK